MSETMGAVDIAHKARALDWLRAELVGSAAQVLRGMVQGDESRTLDALAGNVMIAYLLARRAGISFARLENEMLSRLQAHIDNQHEIEAWYGDLSALREYLERSRGIER